MEQPVYFLDITAKNCKVLITVNGFPALNYSSKFLMNRAQSINQYLIKYNNKVEVKLVPSDLSDGEEATLDAISQIQFTGLLKKYKVGNISSPEGGEILKEFKLDGKVSVEFTFDNLIHDYSKCISYSSVINDDDALKDYGVYLFGMNRQKNASKLLAEFIPKIKDYSRAFYSSFDQNYYEFDAFLRNDFFNYPKKKENLLKGEVILSKWCGGRIYGVQLYPGKDLLSNWCDHTEESEYSMPILLV